MSKKFKMNNLMKTTPFDHQAECLGLMAGRHAYAVLMEQGLGKTWTILADAARMHEEGKLDGLLVVAPRGVHSNWIRREIPAHLGEGSRALTLEYDATKTSTKTWSRAWKELLVHRGLAILAVNVEAISAGKNTKVCLAYRAAERFLVRRRCMMVVDESSRIKTPGSKRTRRVIDLGKRAAYRRIATGTPVTQSPFDLYSQFRFLDPALLGFRSFYEFKNRYGKMERKIARRAGRIWQYDVVTKYVRLGELKKRIAPHSFRRTKAECLDIPEKIYQTVTIRMSPLQKTFYKRMNEEGILEFDDFDVVAPNQLVKLMRLQQITGGFLPSDDPETDGAPIDGGVPPKLAYLVDAVREDYPGKAIVWARFRYEIALLVSSLREEFGARAVVELHGGVRGEDREETVNRFQEDETCRFLVGQQQSGIGITLHAAETVFYYSNSFSYEQRYQSEDRAHRIGLRHPVVYVDLVCDGTVDERVRDVLLKAKRTADKLTGDDERSEG